MKIKFDDVKGKPDKYYIFVFVFIVLLKGLSISMKSNIPLFILYAILGFLFLAVQELFMLVKYNYYGITDTVEQADILSLFAICYRVRFLIFFAIAIFIFLQKPWWNHTVISCALIGMLINGFLSPNKDIIMWNIGSAIGSIISIVLFGTLFFHYSIYIHIAALILTFLLLLPYFIKNPNL